MITAVERSMTSDAGNIFIDTGALVVEDGASISTTLFEEGEGGNLTIWADESIELRGQSLPGNPSAILTSVEFGAIGNAGNILVSTGQLVVEDGALVSSLAFGDGDAGDLTIRADESVELRRKVGSSEGRSRISTSVRPGAVGNAGDLLIETGRLVVADSSAISSSVLLLAEGDGGNLTIRANESVELRDSVILTAVEPEAIGNAGELIIETGRLVLEDAAAISSSTIGEGDGGALTIRATEVVELRDGLIVTAVESGGIGNAGALMIETGRLVLEDGALVSSSTNSSRGNGGALTIHATDTVELRGQNSRISTLVFPSAIGNAGDLTLETGGLWLADTTLITTSSAGTGNAGDLEILTEDWILISGNSALEALTLGRGTVGSITLTTAQLTIQDNGLLSVSAADSFPAGTLTINADLVRLSDDASLQAETEAGDEGSITLNARGVLLRDNSRISTDARETATGGNIIINASDFALLLESSRIDARAVAGQGGNIKISAGFFLQGDNSRIDASSDLGVDGSVSLNTLDLNPIPTVDALPTSFVNVSVDQRCATRDENSRVNRFVQTGRGGLVADADAITWVGLWADMRSNQRDLVTSMQAQPEVEPVSGASRVVANKMPDSIIEAQGWSRDSAGQVVLTAEATAMMSSGSLPTASNCLAG